MNLARIIRLSVASSAAIDLSTGSRFLPSTLMVTEPSGAVRLKPPLASLMVFCSPEAKCAVIVAPATASFLSVTITPEIARVVVAWKVKELHNSVMTNNKLLISRLYDVSIRIGCDRVTLFVDRDAMQQAL